MADSKWVTDEFGTPRFTVGKWEIICGTSRGTAGVYFNDPEIGGLIRQTEVSLDHDGVSVFGEAGFAGDDWAITVTIPWAIIREIVKIQDGEEPWSTD